MADRSFYKQHHLIVLLILAVVLLGLVFPHATVADHFSRSTLAYDIEPLSLPDADLYGFSIDAHGQILVRYRDDGNTSGAMVFNGMSVPSSTGGIRPAAVSADGSLVGWSGYTDRPVARWLDPGGKDRPLPFSSGRIRDLNSSGQWVGEHLMSVGEEVVLGDGESFQSLGQAARCRVAGLNEAGQVAFSLKNEGRFVAYLWDGSSDNLGHLGGGESLAKGMNQRGDVVGRSSLPDGRWHAFLWSEGHIHDLGTLGGSHSQALAINDQGLILGWSHDEQGRRHNVLWKDGQIYDLEPFLGEDGIVVDLNDLNQLVGWQKGPQGRWQAIVATPRS